jgi:penicillin-binding protein 1A
LKTFQFALKFVLTVALGGAALAGSVALLAPAGTGLSGATTPLGPLDVAVNQPAARSVVYDRFGNVMSTLSIEDRQPVALEDVPQVLVDAVIAIEDRKFYEHNGVDWAGTARALFKNVDAGGISQGGSTITQQLVKNTLSTNRKRDLKTKAREAILAIRLEDELPKDRILEDYLNLVYFGNGAYGVQAAAERYFNKPLRELKLAESALLAGLIQAPEALNPVKYPDAAARRRRQVLDAMVETDKTTAKKAKKARSVPLPTKVSYPLSRPLDYYIDEVKNQLLSDDPNVVGDPGEVLGGTQQERAAAVFRGGLRIETAYEPALQLVASASINAVLPRSPFTASLVVIDNADGGVRAIANGRTFEEMQFNPATEGPGRQAGSAFKAFTAAAALSRGYTPNDTISGSPLSWRLGPGTGPGSVYNLSGDCHGGTPTLTRAIAISDNCVFTRLELSLGPGNYGGDGVRTVIDTARTLGIDTSNFENVVSTTLGTNGVHPLEMTQAYSVFANDGVLKRATFITKILDAEGKVLFQAPTVGTRVLDENVARTMNEMLRGPIRGGTASGSLGNFPRPAAGKTGTTDNNVDAWFVGYTPQFTAGVWMGNPDGEIPMRNVGGITVFGGTIPARIWGAFMRAATSNLPPLDFIPPDKTKWGRPSYVSETGRRANINFTPSAPITVPPVTLPAATTVPPTTARVTPTTRKQAPPTTKAPPPPTTVAEALPGP